MHLRFISQNRSNALHMSAKEVHLEELAYKHVDGSDRMKFRLGVYLEELDLTERHSTAIHTI